MEGNKFRDDLAKELNKLRQEGEVGREQAKEVREFERYNPHLLKNIEGLNTVVEVRQKMIEILGKEGFIKLMEIKHNMGGWIIDDWKKERDEFFSNYDSDVKPLIMYLEERLEILTGE